MCGYASADERALPFFLTRRNYGVVMRTWDCWLIKKPIRAILEYWATQSCPAPHSVTP